MFATKDMSHKFVLVVVDFVQLDEGDPAARDLLATVA